MEHLIIRPTIQTSEASPSAPETRIICRVCQKQFSQYTCPRCNTRYCSLQCYKNHSLRCTESFMHENVTQELKQIQPNDETKQKMLDILKRFHSEEEQEQEQDVMDSSDDEDGTLLKEETIEKVLSAVQCIPSEREALLKFKNSLSDEDNHLESWSRSTDCCKWRGITCSNKTGYVIELDLSNPCRLLPDEEPTFLCASFTGHLDSALLKLKHLRHLDVSVNSFDGVSIPKFLGSFPELRYLNLSKSGFGGLVPGHLGNLSRIEIMDLSNSDLYVDSLGWVSKLYTLKLLNMNFIDLSAASHEWINLFSSLPSLNELYLESCSLEDIAHPLPVSNSSSLTSIDVAANNLNASFVHWLANISTLVTVDASFNGISQPIVSTLSKFPNLEKVTLRQNYIKENVSEIFAGGWSRIRLLELSSNALYGELPSSVGNITSLVTLDLSGNENITGLIPLGIGELQNLEVLSFTWNRIGGNLPYSLCLLNKLEVLELGQMLLRGTIPSCLGGLTLLRVLQLGGNQLKGHLPLSLGQLSNLQELDLDGNSLQGRVTEEHFKNLSSLKTLVLSSNSFVLKLPPHWVPPFQLDTLRLKSCYIGSVFPPWLITQIELTYLDLSNTTISGILPEWFFDRLPAIFYSDLSNNKIKDQLPDPLNCSNDAAKIDLSSNLFWGPIPSLINNSQLTTLDISNNQFSGSIPPCFNSVVNFFASNNSISGTIPAFCGERNIGILDLSSNYLTGEMPSNWGNATYLKALDLSGNQLFGRMSLGSLDRLQSLHLSDNNLSGRLPLSLSNCTSLQTLDLGGNKFFGEISSWIGKSFPNLQVLRLRSNRFSGRIASELGNYTSLQVLDVAYNYFSGSIPQSFGNLTAMRTRQITNEVIAYGNSIGLYNERVIVQKSGQSYSYSKTLSLVTSLDLSANNLSGQIPKEVTHLLGLIVLNLSMNHFTGVIPKDIGKLVNLQSLDLSKNNLSGVIPSSLSDLNFLNHLNLSHNNLTGKIPTGMQLQSLDEPSIYSNNLGLCGFPLPNSCEGNKTTIGAAPSFLSTTKSDKVQLYAVIVSGYVTGLLCVLVVLLFKGSWRVALFQFQDHVTNSICTTTILSIARLKRKFARN